MVTLEKLACLESVSQSLINHKIIKQEKAYGQIDAETNQEPSDACIFSMNIAALLIQQSTSSCRCLGYDFLNDVRA